MSKINSNIKLRKEDYQVDVPLSQFLPTTEKICNKNECIAKHNHSDETKWVRGFNFRSNPFYENV